MRLSKMNELEMDKVVMRSYFSQQLDRTTSQNVLSTIEVRQLRSQYDHLVFGTMALRLISRRDGFSNFLSRFKMFERPSRPNSSITFVNRSQYVATSTTLFSRPFGSNFQVVLRTSISVAGVKEDSMEKNCCPSQPQKHFSSSDLFPAIFNPSLPVFTCTTLSPMKFVTNTSYFVQYG